MSFLNRNTVCCLHNTYPRLHLRVNAHAKSMFSHGVKRLCFRCQTLKFLRTCVTSNDFRRLLWGSPQCFFTSPYQWFSQVFLRLLDCDDSKLSWIVFVFCHQTYAVVTSLSEQTKKVVKLNTEDHEPEDIERGTLNMNAQEIKSQTAPAESHYRWVCVEKVLYV